MFNLFKKQVSFLSAILTVLLLSFKSLMFLPNYKFFDYRTSFICFLESFNLLYYYSMPISTAIVLKKRLNLVFWFVASFFCMVYFL